MWIITPKKWFFAGLIFIFATAAISGWLFYSAQHKKIGNKWPQTHLVLIKDNAFSPDRLKIRAGDTVTWKQADMIEHRVSSPGLFDGWILKKGDTYSFTYEKSGQYPYYCKDHPGMESLIIVK